MKAIKQRNQMQLSVENNQCIKKKSHYPNIKLKEKNPLWILYKHLLFIKLNMNGYFSKYDTKA